MSAKLVPPLSIVEMNDRVFAEFRRITGAVDAFVFTSWWAAREREVVRMQDDDQRRAASRWVQLPRAERQARLLAHLKSLPVGWTKPPPREEVPPRFFSLAKVA